MCYVNRYIQNRLMQALGGSPLVFLNGPRQAGKSTFVQTLSKSTFPAEYVTFDSTAQMISASYAPETYLRERKGALIIDEVQLVPDIFRALKGVIDDLRQQHSDKVVGQFLLTGSANIMALPKLSDPLVGRMNLLTLYPLSGAEIAQGKGDFVARLFAKDFTPCDGKYQLHNIIGASTFPEISGVDAHSRTNWFDGYLITLVQRDVKMLAEIQKLNVLPNLLRILANRAGGLVNDADIARDVGLNPVTTRNYKTLLQMLFLTFEVPPWYRNMGKRFVKATKGYMIDTLMICHLLQYELDDLARNRPEIFGHILENFVATELLKLISFHGETVNLFHFRTSDNKKVDFVLEKPNGHLVAVEVKSRDTITPSDLKGMETLRQLTGHHFVCGIILYRGRDVIPFGKNVWAVPICNLWQ